MKINNSRYCLLKKVAYIYISNNGKGKNNKIMEYTLVNETATNAMRLQSIGNVLGTPASKIKKGDILMWNFGSKGEVLEIVKETPKTITIKEKQVGASYVGERKMTKSRLVCILK